MFSSSPDKLFENTLRCFSNSFTVSLFQVATQNSSWQVLIEGDHKAQECGVLFNETSAKAGFKIKCSKQAGGMECGYFVMKYMKDVASDVKLLKQNVMLVVWLGDMYL
ncbi:unnamed protein product [Cuscuta epithymum]|uniref:Ubiquitin-like protease family profile domain-containing protein n=1 Tax=Cuscuta epithymum TaxID=186058 RepID=A0AAV0CZC3_9ASTE|nr:unnamed protein product [Cuscuta epithymum]